jgi:hypothetical protein
MFGVLADDRTRQAKGFPKGCFHKVRFVDNPAVISKNPHSCLVQGSKIY